MRQVAKHGPDRVTAFPNRPASLSALAAFTGDLDQALGHFAQIFPSGDIANQLRTVLTHEGGASWWVGAMRRTRAGFSLREHQRLYAAQPSLLQWSRHSRALGRAPMHDTGLPIATLEAFEAPALVLAGDRVVHANAAARRMDPLPLDPAQLRAIAASRQRFGSRDGDYELLVLHAESGALDLSVLSPACTRSR